MQVFPALRNVGLLAVGVFVLTACGCGRVSLPRYDHHYVIVPGHQGAKGVRRVLLIPPNVVLGPPLVLFQKTEQIADEIEVYLQAHDLEIVRADSEVSRTAWRAAVKSVDTVPQVYVAGDPEEPNWNEAARLFVVSMREQSEFDALVLPTVLHREIWLRERRGVWDGVHRKVRLKDGKSKLAPQFPSKSKVAALSLHVIVFDASGEELFHGIGGLDLVHEVEYRKNRKRWFRRVRENLFEDNPALSDGIEVAFEPYLPRLDDAAARAVEEAAPEAAEVDASEALANGSEPSPPPASP